MNWWLRMFAAQAVIAVFAGFVLKWFGVAK